MQDTCYCFPTELQGGRSSESMKNLPTIREVADPHMRFTDYVDNFDKKLARGMQTQNFNLNIRKRQLIDQLQEVRLKQQIILQDVKRRENYFEEHYYLFLKDDIHKYQEYNQFFKDEFAALHRKIEKANLANDKRRLIMASMKERLKQLMKENRNIERNSTMRLQKIIPKIKNTDSTEASLRMITEPDRRQSSLSSCQELPRISNHYMEPIVRSSRRLGRYEGDKWLELLLEMLTFRKSDGKNKQWLWIEQLIYKPRHFERLREYIKNRIEYIRTTQSH